jgi:3-hydroxyisobutyrate dehydrogenase-like beta-hydroxyacid dehydrogenase
MPTVGLIGLGLMGTALAERFLQSGFAVVGFDVASERRILLTSAGGTATASAAEVVAVCDRIVFSLPTSDIVASVTDQVASTLRPGVTIVDTTTGAPDSAARLGADLAARGVRYLDATVVGSSEQVRQRDVIVLVGGDRAAADACQDLFDCFAQKWFHLGPNGSGARMKLVVNLVLGLNRAVLAEGLTFARACGLDLAETLRVLQAGAAYSRCMDAKGSKMVEQSFFPPQAKLSQHLKDVRLILDEATREGLELPLSAIHRELLERAEAAGWGDADNAAILHAFAKLV